MRRLLVLSSVLVLGLLLVPSLLDSQVADRPELAVPVARVDRGVEGSSAALAGDRDSAGGSSPISEARTSAVLDPLATQELLKQIDAASTTFYDAMAVVTAEPQSPPCAKYRS